MQTQTSTQVRHGNAYNLFILVLTVMSLVVMVLLVLPLSGATHDLLTFYDNAICVVFLFDFAVNLLNAERKRDYFIGERGWLDLLGSVPSFQILRFTALLRLARLSRLARITRLLRGQNKEAIVEDVLKNRAQYAAFITVLLAFIVLFAASVIVLNAESRSDEANIDSGWDAFWWGIVTLTTVGYGDRYPVTVMGRIGAMFVMVMGIGIIGALASILASVLVGDSDEEEPAASAADLAAVTAQLEALTAELTRLRSAVEARPPGDSG